MVASTGFAECRGRFGALTFAGPSEGSKQHTGRFSYRDCDVAVGLAPLRRTGTDFWYTKISARPGSDFIYTNVSAGRGPTHSAEAALMPTTRECDANCDDVAALRAAFFRSG